MLDAVLRLIAAAPRPVVLTFARLGGADAPDAAPPSRTPSTTAAEPTAAGSAPIDATPADSATTGEHSASLAATLFRVAPRAKRAPTELRQGRRRRRLQALFLAKRDEARAAHCEGDCAAAAALYRACIDAGEAGRGPDDAGVLAAQADLVEVLIDTGALAEATALCRSGIEARLAVGDGELVHERVLLLGALLHAQRSFREACACFRCAKQELSAKWGAAHFTTKTATRLYRKSMAATELATTAGAESQRAKDAGEPLMRYVLARREVELGTDHLATVHAVERLAALLLRHGKFAEAEPLNRRALRACKGALGEVHARTLAAGDALAALLVQQKCLAEAESLYWHSVEERALTLGKHHPETIASYDTLGALLQLDGHLEEASDMWRRSFEAKCATLGEMDHATLTAALMWARLLRKRKHYSEAHPLLRFALDGFRKDLGAEHEMTRAVQKRYDRNEECCAAT